MMRLETLPISSVLMLPELYILFLSVVLIDALPTDLAYFPPQKHTSTNTPPTGVKKGRTVLWSEEFKPSFSYPPFSGESINDSVWSFDLGTGDGGWGNQELQTYTDRLRNVRVSRDGKLAITALKDFRGNITSGRIRTQDKVEVLYGTIEAKIKLPKRGLDDGLWPAFWMMGGNFREVGWPSCGEVDILEMGVASAIRDGTVNQRVLSAAHWESDGIKVDYSSTLDHPSGDINDGDFHHFVLEWTPERLETYVDGNQIWIMDIDSDSCPECTEFHQPHFLVLNMAVGGAFTGILEQDNITASFPAQYIVDYVRVYDNGHTKMSGTVFEELVEYDFDCGTADSCTQSALNNYAGDFTCGHRIESLMSTGLTEQEACRQVAGIEYPDFCGVCVRQSITCDQEDTCTDAVLDADAGGFSCRDRISFLVSIYGQQEQDACDQIAQVEFPAECGRCAIVDCGLPDTCTEEVLSSDTAGIACLDRITFLMSSGEREVDACNRVAGVEFPDECGACNPLDCNRPDTCTTDALAADADGTSCGERIAFLVYETGWSEIDACNQITAVEFPNECAPCGPVDCDMPETCTREVLNVDADGPTCGERIDYLINYLGFSETDACNRVASVEYSEECGPCNPIDCNLPGLCTDSILDMDTGGVTCRDRILFEMGGVTATVMIEVEACSIVSATYPDECGSCKPIDCGLAGVCTDAILDNDAGGFTCRERIIYLIGTGLSEQEACEQVGGTEFPSECSACSPFL